MASAASRPSGLWLEAGPGGSRCPNHRMRPLVLIARPLHRTARASMGTTFQERYFALVAEIERDFRVAQWKIGDLDIWPVARMDLFLDLHRQHTGEEVPPSSAPPQRVAALLATPFTNIWKSRRDLRNWIVRPFRAHAVLLGDGVSLDLIDGAWPVSYTPHRAHETDSLLV